MIDHLEAARALSDIEDITKRVRQSQIYRLSSLLMILWGVLVFAGNLATYLAPLYAGITWRSVYVLAIGGSIAVGVVRKARSGTSSFDLRSLLAFVMFSAFGSFVETIGHFGPREMGAFWPIYFMLFYCLAGLWFGMAFTIFGLCVIALTLIGYAFIDGAFPLWMAFVNGGGLILGGLWMRRS
ncbi:conserved hypothetical protein; putative membrane protein [Bradyrhizobium sp. ORS 278]|uniref:hypothetical protein n=1 Tax=Bradyrhizobium sp. (strain ORS 278) TaxID=114615 RepID=UPI00015084DB|nr:hypothetical protein [Bradyrhizobium sp. ORS 278]CAL79742.1 conserved hypothetical protein; putative membrane protein [Bradyrhizobium sp. ORS 278]